MTFNLTTFYTVSFDQVPDDINEFRPELSYTALMHFSCTSSYQPVIKYNFFPCNIYFWVPSKTVLENYDVLLSTGQPHNHDSHSSKAVRLKYRLLSSSDVR
jgi:hypothetical protein